MKFFAAFIIFIAFLLTLFVTAYVADDVAMIRAGSARDIALLQCERDSLEIELRAQLVRDAWRHEIELRNLDAGLRRMELDHEAERNESTRLRGMRKAGMHESFWRISSDPHS